MIEKSAIIEWYDQAPWVSPAQVEQDLILSRILCEIFSSPFLQEKLAFRGGTALNKLYFKPPLRYSEDIDLVQIHPGPIGDILDALRIIIDPWLGDPKRKQNQGRVSLIYRFQAEEPAISMRVKLEINSREHFTVLGLTQIPFTIENQWYSGQTQITTYKIEELLATKLRALYQRLKGRDLFDLFMALRLLNINAEQIIECFQHYMQQDSLSVSRAEFEKNMHEKLSSSDFLVDMQALLQVEHKHDPVEEYKLVHQELISKLPGDTWKGI
jgi:predicted nucleotidyltransferase component of viral defense system